MSAAGLPPSIRSDLESIFRAAVAEVDPDRLVMRALDGATSGAERAPTIIAAARGVYLLAAGKAALAMGTAAERVLGARLTKGLAIVPKGLGPAPQAGAAVSRLKVVEASHPIADAASERAARAALELAAGVGPGDLLLVALSGGASAMLAAPADGISLHEKSAVTSALSRAGASIRELNTVRKHLSRIKGGRLLRAIDERANVLSLILSDVADNDVATIGSGPTAADPSTYADAIGVLKRRFGLWGRTPETVREHLELGAAGRIDETVKPGDPVLARATNLIVGDNRTALLGAERGARKLGYAVDCARELRGEASDLGRALAAQLCALRSPRLCVLAGGEPVVTVAGSGQGGRAQQCALAFAIELARLGADRAIAALFAGTDGIDGPTDAAGAFVDPGTVARARAAGVRPEEALRRNDSYRLFEAIGDLLVTGPTGTNVADVFVGLANY